MFRASCAALPRGGRGCVLRAVLVQLGPGRGKSVIHPELLEILRCPDDRSRLHEADAGLVARLNQAIAEKRLKNRAGRPVESPLDGGLVRQDGRFVYPIVDGIPVLLVDEAIPLDQVAAD